MRETGLFPNDRAFTGREFDAETGLYHYRARAYDPETGRFLQRDPRWAPNPYAYAANNPATLTDPFGEQEGKKECKESYREFYRPYGYCEDCAPGTVCGIKILAYSMGDPCALNCPQEVLDAGSCCWKMRFPLWDICFVSRENCHFCVGLPVEIPYKPEKVCCDTNACDECFNDCMTDTENFWGYADLLDGLICMRSCLGVGNGNSIPPPGLGPDKGGPSADSCGCGCAEEGILACPESQPPDPPQIEDLQKKFESELQRIRDILNGIQRGDRKKLDSLSQELLQLMNKYYRISVGRINFANGLALMQDIVTKSGYEDPFGSYQLGRDYGHNRFWDFQDANAYPFNSSSNVYRYTGQNLGNYFFGYNCAAAGYDFGVCVAAGHGFELMASFPFSHLNAPNDQEHIIRGFNCHTYSVNCLNDGRTLLP